MVEYKITSQNFNHETTGCYTSYGIAAIKNNRVIKAIEDISVDKNAVETLVYKFNKHKLELCHLSASVEDYLCDLCTD